MYGVHVYVYRIDYVYKYRLWVCNLAWGSLLPRRLQRNLRIGVVDLTYTIYNQGATTPLYVS